MKMKIFLAVALVMLLLQPVLVNAEENDDSGSEAPPPSNSLEDGNSGCNCDCPSEEILAQRVVEKLNMSKGKVPDLSQFKNFDKIEVNLSKSAPLNLSSFSGSAVDILQQTRAVIDTPLTESSGHPIVKTFTKALGLVGIDLSTLTLRDTPQIASCVIISAGGLWNYLTTLHACLSDVIDTKLAKEAPQRLKLEERKKSIESAYESTAIISKELVSNKTAALFGWSR